MSRERSCGRHHRQDIVSYNREQATGNSDFNLVTLTMHHHGLALHDAVLWLVKEHAELEAQFLQCHSAFFAAGGPAATDCTTSTVQAVHDALKSSVAGSICSGTDIPYVLSSMWTNKTNPSTTSDPRGEPGGERNTTGSVMVLPTPSNKDWLKRSMQKKYSLHRTYRLLGLAAYHYHGTVDPKSGNAMG